jgi:hypothetical protein
MPFDFETERARFERNPAAIVPAARTAVLMGAPFVLLFIGALVFQSGVFLWIGAAWLLIFTVSAALYLIRYDNTRPASGRHASGD